MLTLEQSEQALRSGSVAASATRDIVIVGGPEAASYLHGQLSQDIEGLAEGSSAWSLLLEPNGRVTSWGRITRVSPEAYWIDVDVGAGAATLERLERFKLRTKATFELREAAPAIAVRGPECPSARDLLELIARAGGVTASAVDRVMAVDLDWPGSSGVDLLGLELDAVVDVLSSAAVAAGPSVIVELERVEAGRPAMGREFGEKTIPAETGVVERSADFSKGCYVGQELVARVDSRGNNTPRTVHPVRLDAGQVPSLGDELFIDGSAIGTFTSVAPASGHVAALASIKRGVEVPSSAIVTVDGEPAIAEIAEVHWV